MAGSKRSPSKASSGAAKANSPSKKKMAPGPGKSNFRKVNSPGKPGNKNPVIIRFAIIENFAVGAHITYRTPTNRGPYAEYLLWSCTGATEGTPVPEWAADMSINKERAFLHVDNVIQKHYPESAYHIRYFFFDIAIEATSEEDLLQALRKLANDIAYNVNQMFDKNKGDAGKIHVPEDDEELIYSRHGVVSDLIGTESASRKLRNWLGEDWKGDFNENRDHYRAFFRQGHIPRNLQGFLNAPDNEIEPLGAFNPPEEDASNVN